MSKFNFEKTLSQLEKIVQDLESGELDLDEALKKFEEGIKLSKQCSNKLDESEKKISLLIEKTNGSYQKTPFESE
ncbi:MAG: exodeoxyribonuclease VII small subunit [Desulfobacteraceae bacterium]|nr:exodeoxyribonuclease VII small subunit [Desulfobacteraceae bacterium]